MVFVLGFYALWYVFTRFGKTYSIFRVNESDSRGCWSGCEERVVYTGNWRKSAQSKLRGVKNNRAGNKPIFFLPFTKWQKKGTLGSNFFAFFYNVRKVYGIQNPVRNYTQNIKIEVRLCPFLIISKTVRHAKKKSTVCIKCVSIFSSFYLKLFSPQINILKTCERHADMQPSLRVTCQLFLYDFHEYSENFPTTTFTKICSPVHVLLNMERMPGLHMSKLRGDTFLQFITANAPRKAEQNN